MAPGSARNGSNVPPVPARAADQFTRRKLDWLDQVHADRRVSDLAFRLAYAIGGYLNRNSGDAFPSQGTLARVIGRESRTVRNAAKELVACGHLAVTEGQGRGKTNLYRPILKDDGLDETVTEIRNDGSPIVGLNPEPPFPLLAASNTAPAFPFLAEKGNGGAQKGERPCTKSGTAVPTEHTDEHTEKSKSAKAHKGWRDHEGFRKWYAAYPRHESPAAAFKAYLRVLKQRRATEDELLAGAKCYQAWCERIGREAQFIKCPATWLNGDCWHDQLGEPAKAGGDPSATAELRSPETFTPDDWRQRLNMLNTRGGAWPTAWGPRPGAPGCLVPEDLLPGLSLANGRAA
jgi:Helix-turn-helix domain